MDHEVWKVVPGFIDYAVSNLGSVRRLNRDARNHVTRVLKPWLGNHGYETITLVSGGVQHKRLVHRLVCEAFHGPAPVGADQVAHGDGTRLNNRADNLRWASRSENMADCIVHGTRAMGPTHGRSVSPERTPRGERHGSAKLTEEDVRAIRREPVFPGSGRMLASWFGVSPAAITNIIKGKTWKHVA